MKTFVINIKPIDREKSDTRFASIYESYLRQVEAIRLLSIHVRNLQVLTGEELTEKQK